MTGVESLETRRLLSGGARDSNFGTAGTVTNGSVGLDSVVDIDPLPDGKTIATSYKGAIVRLDTNGQLDPTFGNLGKLQLDGVSTVAPTSDGGLIAYGGTVPGANSHVVIRKLTAAGTVDPSFGNGGYVVPAALIGPNDLSNLRTTADGRIVLAYGYNIVQRFMPNGRPDTSFGVADAQPNDGTAALPAGFVIKDFAMLPDGGMIVAAVKPSVGLGLVHLDASGAMDTTYGQNGFSLAAAQTQASEPTVRLRSDGKAYLLAERDGDSAVFCFNPDGTLDPTYGEAGVYQHDYGAFLDVATDGIVQADGGLTLVAYSMPSFSSSGAIISQITPYGTPDRSFGTGGSTSFKDAKYGFIQRFLPTSNGDLLLLMRNTSLSNGDPNVSLLSRYSRPDVAAPAVTVAGRVLQLNVSSTPDRVTLTRTASGYRYTVATLSGEVPQDQVDSIVINTGSGEDSLSLTGVDRPLQVNAGDGTDVLQIHATSGAAVRVDSDAITSGQGATQFSGVESLLYSGTDSADHVTLARLPLDAQLTLDLADGDDTVDVEADPLNLAGRDAVLVGGSGDDQINVRIARQSLTPISFSGGQLHLPGVGSLSTDEIEALSIRGSTGAEAFHIEPAVGLAVAVDGAGGDDTLAIEPTSEINPAVVYESADSGDVRFDAPYGSIQFDHVVDVTVAADTTGPRVVNHQVEQEFAFAVAIDFSESIGTSLTADELILTNQESGLTIPVAAARMQLSSLQNGGTRVVVTLSYAMARGTYLLSIPAGAVQDSDGNRNTTAAGVAFAYSPGDATGNGACDFFDLLIVARNYGKAVSGRSAGDLTYDGKVSFDDLLLVARNFEEPNTAAAPAVSGPTQTRRRAPVIALD